jgi:hypothetical protein
MFEWMGTYSPAAYLTIPATIDFQQQHDWPAVRAACHELLLEASQRIDALTGLYPCRPVIPPASRRGCGMSTRLKCRWSSGMGGSSYEYPSSATTAAPMWIGWWRR